MPVTFRSPVEISRFDASVRKLAPIINELREERSCRSTRKLADRLNEMGQTGPNGKSLSYATMRRILERMAQLHLGPGPSSRKQAARDRKTPFHQRRRNRTEIALRRALATIVQAQTKSATDFRND